MSLSSLRYILSYDLLSLRAEWTHCVLNFNVGFSEEEILEKGVIYVQS